MIFNSPLVLRLPDDSGAAPALAGALPAGQSSQQTFILKNTGTEAVTSVLMWVTNSAANPSMLTVTANGVTLPDLPQPIDDSLPDGAVEVLADSGSTLAAGESVPVVLTWTAPANAPALMDSAAVNWADA